MTIALDVRTNIGYGTGTVSGSHAAASSGVIGVVVATTNNYSLMAPHQVTYGGIAMMDMGNGPHGWAGYGSSIHFWVLTDNIPQGTQTVNVYPDIGNVDKNASRNVAVTCWTFTGSGKMKVEDQSWTGGGGSAMAANASITLDSGSATTYRMFAVCSDRDAPSLIGLPANHTARYDLDYGTFCTRIFDRDSTVSGSEACTLSIASDYGGYSGIAVSDEGDAWFDGAPRCQYSAVNRWNNATGRALFATVTPPASLDDEVLGIYAYAMRLGSATQLVTGMDLDGSNFTQLTNSGWGIAHWDGWLLTPGWTSGSRSLYITSSWGPALHHVSYALMLGSGTLLRVQSVASNYAWSTSPGVTVTDTTGRASLVLSGLCSSGATVQGWKNAYSPSSTIDRTADWGYTYNEGTWATHLGVGLVEGNKAIRLGWTDGTNEPCGGYAHQFQLEAAAGLDNDQLVLVA